MLRIFYKEYLLISALIVGISVNGWSADFGQGVLWKVSKSGQESSFILGTIHSDDPSVTNLPAKVSSALQQSRSFTAELDLNLNSIMQAQMQMLLPGDKTLQSVIGAQRYKKCVGLMAAYGAPEMMVSKMKPWAIAAQLSMPKPQTGIFLDLKLYQMAQSQGKKIYGLETVAEQMGIFDSMSLSQQLIMLDQAIKDYPTMPAKINLLLRLYVKRDLQGMERFSKKEMKKVNPEMAKLIDTKLIKERNHRMVDRMQPQLAAGKAFIAVGSLHLPGEQGILNLLQQRGYTLSALY